MAVGLAAGNSAGTILQRALVALAVAWFVGRIIGGLAMRVVHDHVEAYKREHPIPTDLPGDPANAPAVEDAPAPGGEKSG
jgi:hypothetical protein